MEEGSWVLFHLGLGVGALPSLDVSASWRVAAVREMEQDRALEARGRQGHLGDRWEPEGPGEGPGCSLIQMEVARQKLPEKTKGRATGTW